MPKDHGSILRPATPKAYRQHRTGTACARPQTGLYPQSAIRVVDATFRPFLSNHSLTRRQFRPSALGIQSGFSPRTAQRNTLSAFCLRSEGASVRGCMAPKSADRREHSPEEIVIPAHIETQKHAHRIPAYTKRTKCRHRVDSLAMGLNRP